MQLHQHLMASSCEKQCSVMTKWSVFAPSIVRVYTQYSQCIQYSQGIQYNILQHNLFSFSYRKVMYQQVMHVECPFVCVFNLRLKMNLDTFSILCRSLAAECSL